MSITLSDITLLPGIMWVDRWTSQRVSQKVLRTIGGAPVFYHSPLYPGNQVTLESLDDQGWQTFDIVERLHALAAVPGAQYLLNYRSVQMSVVFRHEEPPAFEATPMIPQPVPDAGQYFLVKLRLITV